MRLCSGLLLLSLIIGCDQMGAARKQRELEETMAAAKTQREERLKLIVGLWHRDRPIDYQRRGFDMLEFISMSTPSEPPADPQKAFISDGFVSELKGDFLSMVGANLHSYFRIEGSTLQLNLVKPFHQYERADWEIVELTATKLVLKDHQGKTSQFFRVDQDAHRARAKKSYDKSK